MGLRSNGNPGGTNPLPSRRRPRYGRPRSYRAFAGAGERDLTLADVELGVARAWLADFVERGREPATVAARARALRVFSHWIVTDEYVRTDPLGKRRVASIPRTIVETFTTDQMTDLLAAAPAPLAITLRIFLDTGVRLGEATGLRMSDVGDGQLRVLGKRRLAQQLAKHKLMDHLLLPRPVQQ